MHATRTPWWEENPQRTRLPARRKTPSSACCASGSDEKDIKMKTKLPASALIAIALMACGGDHQQVTNQPVAPPPTAPGAPSAPQPGSAQQINISIPSGAATLSAEAFGPPRRIMKGSTVTWVNNDSVPHTV